jgi:phosphate starvation-inducible membrane PsiE
MPVRFLIYVAITALTRLLISNVSHHNPPDLGIIYLCGGILFLAFAILVVRYLFTISVGKDRTPAP